MRRNVFIIAEAGVNHNGSLDIACKLIDEAARAGADAVKFQTFYADRLLCPSSLKADYQKVTTGEGESQFEMIRRLELTTEMHEALIGQCMAKGIKFLSTPFDIESMDYLVSLGLDTIKIPSGEVTNLPYLRHAGSLGKKIILSTGMSTLEEVGAALEALTSAGTPRADIVVLHCNTEYPTPFEDVNLRAMLTLRDELNVRVGYSDHALGIEIPVAAVAMGAEIIEKHFTLDRTMDGPDHRASLEPGELAAMVSAIRNIEVAMGDGVKRPSPSESKNIAVVRKSIVASRDIRKGEEFTKDNLAVKRPGTGISPMLWDSIIGNKAKRDFAPDEGIEV